MIYRVLIFSGCLISHLAFSQIVQKQVIPGELPDPSVIEVDGSYYACGSSNDWGPVFPVYRSEDLQHWQLISYVFSTPPAWTVSSYWAPELFFRNDTFYCYYTARRTDGVSCIGVATTKDIKTGFRDSGELIAWGEEAIDAFVYDENGTLFITWKAYGLTPDKPITIMGSELSADGLSLKGDAFEILTAEEDSWEKGGMEGQCIVRHGDYLYMLYSGNACCGADCDYQVGVARARTMRGPWQKFAGNPVLKGNETWKCPGHGTALETNGSWYYLYHAYPSDGFPYLGRTALLSELQWAHDGWPVFNVADGISDNGIIRENISDDFTGNRLASYWRYDVASYTFEVQVHKGMLSLKEKSRITGNQAGAALCIQPDDADFTITTHVTNQNRALKGIILYATHANSVGLGVRGDSLILWKVKDKEFQVLNTIRLDHPAETPLRAIVRGAHLIEFQFKPAGYNWETISGRDNNHSVVSGENLAWWSWGMKPGIAVKADNQSGENTGTFDTFKVTYAEE